MKQVLVVDHRGADSNRRKSIAALIENTGVTVRELAEIYGETEKVLPTTLTDDLRARVQNQVASTDLLLLHAGDDQHLVLAVLADPVLANMPVLLYTASPLPSKDTEAFLRSETASRKHRWIPQPISLSLAPEWIRSEPAQCLRRCVDLVLRGADPEEAIAVAFVDRELEDALEQLWQMVAQGASYDEIRKVRDEKFRDPFWGGA